MRQDPGPPPGVDDPYNRAAVFAAAAEHAAPREPPVAAALAARFYPDHAGLLHKVCVGLRRWTLSSFGLRLGRDELNGWAYLRYVNAWRFWDPAQGELSTYLFKFRWRHALVVGYLRNESESWRHWLWRSSSLQVELSASGAEREYHESEYRLYRVPQRDEDWTWDVYDALGGPGELAGVVAKALPRREAEVVMCHARGLTHADLAGLMRVSKQRAHQLHAAGLGRLRARLQADPRTAELFGAEAPRRRVGVKPARARKTGGTF